METAVGKLALERPGMVASGIMDETGASMVRMIEAGAGAVVTKSIGLEARPGHANPCFTEVKGGFVNAMGLPNPGIDLFREEMEVAVPHGNIVGSIFGSNAKEFAELAGKMEDYGACAIELNLSCPHAKGYGMEVGTDPELVRAIVSDVKAAVSIPVWAKLTPNTHILNEIALAAQDGGCDAIVAINTLKAMVISPEFGKPFLSNRFGGLSGPAVRAVGVRNIFDLYDAVSIPLVGVGGISDWRDAAQYIMAGAVAFQIGSAVAKDGPEVFSKVNRGLSEFMHDFGYASIRDMVGVAHE
ncbi:dihydroorotate dehydrogenase (subfamily 1) family protein [Thermoplasmatales archaeon BRNA1]|nr:dihydroorotate dehydrogenase (subfamily 1) family protein [Thermoplasmatales archaeon BRNA1]